MDEQHNLSNQPEPAEPAVQPPAPVSAPAAAQTVPPAPEAAPFQPAAVEPPKKSKKFRKLVIVGFAGALLLGGSAAGYIGYVVPNKPENVLVSAVDKTINQQTNVDSGRFDGFFEVWPGARVTFDGHFSGSNVDGRLSTGLAVQYPTLAFRSIGQDLYLKLDGIKNSAELAQSYTNASGEPTVDETLAKLADSLGGQVFGRWFKVPVSYLNSVASMAGTSVPSTQLSEQEREAFVQSVRDGEAFYIESFIGKEDVKGEPSNHYKIRAQKDGLKRLLDQYTGKLGMSADQLNEAKQAIDKLDDRLLSFDLWVSLKHKTINQLTFDSSTVDDTQFVKFSFTLLDINQGGGDVTAPEDAQPIETLMEQLFSSGALDL